MDELEIVLKEDFESLSWDDLKNKIGEPNTKITYDTDESKYGLASMVSKLSMPLLFVICVVSFALPVAEFLYTGGVWFLALTIVDAAYLMFRKRINPILEKIWGVVFFVFWIDAYHHIILFIIINVFITIILLFSGRSGLMAYAKRG